MQHQRGQRADDTQAAAMPCFVSECVMRNGSQSSAAIHVDAGRSPELSYAYVSACRIEDSNEPWRKPYRTHPSSVRAGVPGIPILAAIYSTTTPSSGHAWVSNVCAVAAKRLACSPLLETARSARSVLLG